MTRACEILRNLLASPELTYLMEAHDGLSARVVEAAAFPAIWASGLAISSCLGLRDVNEISAYQMIEAVDRIVGATSLPVLVDGDCGYGDFNNARLFTDGVRKRGAAGVCFEDKVFPKRNSFLPDAQELADIEEFCGLIRASRDVAADQILVVARTEAFIAGKSLDEALERATAYENAGADALFVHSRRSDAQEIESFMDSWTGRLPVLIAPTTYSGVPSSTYERLGISGVIWANQTLRASLGAMVKACQTIRESASVSPIEGDIASVKDIFSLLDYAEYHRASAVYARP